MRKHLGALSAASLVLVVGTSSAQAASCSTVEYWRPQHIATQGALIGLTQASEIAIALARALTIENVLGALKVNNRQVSAEGERQQLVTKNSQMAYASTMTEAMRRDRLVAIKENYSIESGQGVNACSQVATIGAVTGSMDGHPGAISRSYQEPDVAPGRVVPVNAQAADRADPASTDGTVLLSRTASMDQKRKVIQQLAGFTPPKPDASVTGTPQGEIMLIQARQVEAWRSPALVSLAAVAAATDSSGHSISMAGGGSVFDAMDKLIDNYGGGPAYATWTAALQGQSERGLMVELGRLRALSMRLRTFKQESETRLTAVAASMLAAEAQ